MPTFSIIIPVYNVEPFIKQCIESVLNQTYKDFEAIFVDDCGNDNSMKIVEEYAKEDNRIVILRHTQNKGISCARNTALDYASGEYITCLDPDDWFETNALEVIYEALKTYNVDSIWFDANRFYNNTQNFDKEPVIKCVRGPLTVEPNHICYYTEFSWGKAYKTSTIKNNNIRWPENINYGEDGVFYYKYYALHPNIMIIENRLYNYRMRDGSAVRNKSKSLSNLKDMNESIIDISHFYDENNMTHNNITLLRFVDKTIKSAKNVFGSLNEFNNLSLNTLEQINFTEKFKEFDIPMNPLVSVVIDTYKIKEPINVIRSVQSQSHKNIEIICFVNDTDKKLLKQIDKISEIDKRITLISYNPNKFDDTFEYGLKSINGYYYIFIEKDYIMKPVCIQTITDNFKKTNVNMVLCSIHKNNNDYVSESNDFLYTINSDISNIQYEQWLPIYKQNYISNTIQTFGINHIVNKFSYTYLIKQPLVSELCD